MDEKEIRVRREAAERNRGVTDAFVKIVIIVKYDIAEARWIYLCQIHNDRSKKMTKMATTSRLEGTR